MNLEKVIGDLLKGEDVDYEFSRVLAVNESSKIITRRLNDTIKRNPDLQDVALALILLPALEWMLKGQDVTEVMAQVSKGEANIARLTNIQRIITRASGKKPELLFRERQRYFAACEQMVTILTKCVSSVKHYPNNGKLYYSILKSLFSSEITCPSNYLINKYMESAIELVYSAVGGEVEGLIDELLSEHVPSDEEMKTVYHNVKVLLNEYNRIMWYAQHSDDKAMRLLQCETTEEILAITHSDEKYRQAYVLVEYIKFINGAIEMVRDFPGEGKLYYSIIKSIIDLKPQSKTDSEIAYMFSMSTCTFSIKKGRAFAVLSSILWGCSSDNFVQLLTQ